MKIRGSFEQALCILIIISASSKPVKSFQLSERLHVSDSYLKKIIRQLVIHGLIQSIVSKNGGFILQKKPSEITLLDLFNVIEGAEHFAQNTGLADKLFDTKEEVIKKETMIMQYLNAAEDEYRMKLKEITLDKILPAAYLTAVLGTDHLD